MWQGLFAGCCAVVCVDWSARTVLCPTQSGLCAVSRVLWCVKSAVLLALSCLCCMLCLVLCFYDVCCLPYAARRVVFAVRNARSATWHL